jgi:hypothetical protein
MSTNLGTTIMGICVITPPDGAVQLRTLMPMSERVGLDPGAYAPKVRSRCELRRRPLGRRR